MIIGIGLLIARLLLGLALATHGAQKLFGWFGGYGLRGTGGFFENLGFRPGVLFAAAAGSGEFAGGILTALGWLNPIGPALIVAVMTVAIVSVHLSKGFWSQNGGYELTTMNIAAATALAFAGPGVLSVDSLIRIPVLSQPSVIWLSLAIALAGASLSLAARREPKGAPAEQARAA